MVFLPIGILCFSWLGQSFIARLWYNLNANASLLQSKTNCCCFCRFHVAENRTESCWKRTTAAEPKRPPGQMPARSSVLPSVVSARSVGDEQAAEIGFFSSVGFVENRFLTSRVISTRSLMVDKYLSLITVRPQFATSNYVDVSGVPRLQEQQWSQ